jgi:uncharacterized protein YbjT (DUF2867 family)
VLLSSIGGHLSEGTGPILGLHDFEERLKDAGIPAAFLRPRYFMENHLHAIPVIKGMGVYADAIAAGYPFTQVATKDIGLKAAELLVSGATGPHYLYGPREYSMSEAARILGAAAENCRRESVQTREPRKTPRAVRPDPRQGHGSCGAGRTFRLG